MSWFVLGSKKVIAREEKSLKKKYGKVKSFNEKNDFESIPTVDNIDGLEDDSKTDNNIDESFDLEEE